jgi:hypothetical protein
LSITLIYSILAVIHQRYDLEVQNPGGFIGSNVIIKCNIPQFVKEYVKVTSWLEEPMHNIYPSQEGGELRPEKNLVLGIETLGAFLPHELLANPLSPSQLVNFFI